MRIREAAIFAAYASVIVYGLVTIPSLLMERSSTSSFSSAILMIPLTFAAVFITAVKYLQSRPLDHPAQGAALGAHGAFGIYCFTVFCLMAIFYSTVANWSEDGRPGQAPGAFGLYAIILSPVLMPASLFFGALAGIVYVHLKHFLGFTRSAATGSATPTRRRRQMSAALKLTAMVIVAIPIMIFLGGLPALMLLNALQRP